MTDAIVPYKHNITVDLSNALGIWPDILQQAIVNVNLYSDMGTPVFTGEDEQIKVPKMTQFVEISIRLPADAFQKKRVVDRSICEGCLNVTQD